MLAFRLPMHACFVPVEETPSPVTTPSPLLHRVCTSCSHISATTPVLLATRGCSRFCWPRYRAASPYLSMPRAHSSKLVFHLRLIRHHASLSGTAPYTRFSLTVWASSSPHLPKSRRFSHVSLGLNIFVARTDHLSTQIVNSPCQLGKRFSCRFTRPLRTSWATGGLHSSARHRLEKCMLHVRRPSKAFSRL